MSSLLSDTQDLEDCLKKVRFHYLIVISSEILAVTSGFKCHTNGAELGCILTFQAFRIPLSRDSDLYLTETQCFNSTPFHIKLAPLPFSPFISQHIHYPASPSNPNPHLLPAITSFSQPPCIYTRISTFSHQPLLHDRMLCISWSSHRGVPLRRTV